MWKRQCACAFLLFACTGTANTPVEPEPNGATPGLAATPSLVAASSPSPSAQAPSEPPRGVTKLREAASAGDYAMAKAWLDQGTDVNAADASDPARRTALIAAVERGHFDVVKLLVARGANIHTQNAQGRSALDIAQQKDPELVALLTGEAAPTEPAPVAVKARSADYGKDPSMLDPGALINPDAPAPKPVTVKPAAEESSSASAPSPPKESARDKERKRKCADVKEQLARTRATYEAQSEQQKLDNSKLAQELLALDISYNLGCP
jgi:hypothetical protein